MYDIIYWGAFSLLFLGWGIFFALIALDKLPSSPWYLTGGKPSQAERQGDDA